MFGWMFSNTIFVLIGACMEIVGGVVQCVSVLLFFIYFLFISQTEPEQLEYAFFVGVIWTYSERSVI